MGLIGSNPSRSTIMAEFGPNTRPSNGSLKDAWTLIFGGTNYSRDGFGTAGVGRADGGITPTPGGAATGETTATLQGNIIDQGLDTTWWFE